MFQEVLSLHAHSVKLSNPTLQMFDKAKALEDKIKSIEANIDDPQNNHLLEILCSEATNTQRMKDEMDALISKQLRQIRITKNALSKAMQVCQYWKAQKYWNEVGMWQRVVNAA